MCNSLTIAKMTSSNYLNLCLKSTGEACTENFLKATSISEFIIENSSLLMLTRNIRGLNETILDLKHQGLIDRDTQKQSHRVEVQQLNSKIAGLEQE